MVIKKNSGKIAMPQKVNCNEWITPQNKALNIDTNTMFLINFWRIRMTGIINNVSKIGAIITAPKNVWIDISKTGDSALGKANSNRKLSGIEIANTSKETLIA